MSDTMAQEGRTMAEEGQNKPTKFFVDFENVHGAGLKGVADLDAADEVIIVYSQAAETFHIEQAIDILKSKARIEFLEADAGTRNAADFQLIVALFGDMSDEFDYAIVSGDGGFDAAIKMGERMGLPSVRRLANVRGDIEPEKVDKPKSRRTRRRGGQTVAAQVDAAQAEPEKAEPAKAETAKAETEKSEPAKAEHAKADEPTADEPKAHAQRLRAALADSAPLGEETGASSKGAEADNSDDKAGGTAAATAPVVSSEDIEDAQRAHEVVGDARPQEGDALPAADEAAREEATSRRRPRRRRRGQGAKEGAGDAQVQSKESANANQQAGAAPEPQPEPTVEARLAAEPPVDQVSETHQQDEAHPEPAPEAQPAAKPKRSTRSRRAAKQKQASETQPEAAEKPAKPEVAAHPAQPALAVEEEPAAKPHSEPKEQSVQEVKESSQAESASQEEAASEAVSQAEATAETAAKLEAVREYLDRNGVQLEESQIETVVTALNGAQGRQDFYHRIIKIERQQRGRALYRLVRDHYEALMLLV